MRVYNVIWVFNPDCDKVLMCFRHKQPYLGLYNLVGGKVEAGENGLDAAYRELAEETGISRADITLHHLMDFTYHMSDVRVEAYFGKLKRNIVPSGDEKELTWIDVSENLFDLLRFAGEGNIGHIYEQIKLNLKRGALN